VPEPRFELGRPCGPRSLSPLRLPFRHSGAVPSVPGPPLAARHDRANPNDGVVATAGYRRQAWRVEHVGTLVPGAAPSMGPVRRPPPALLRPSFTSLLRSVGPIVVIGGGIGILTLDAAWETPAIRILLAIAVFATSWWRASVLRGRARLVEVERDAWARLDEGEERLSTLLQWLPAAVYLDRYRRDGSFIEIVYVSPQMADLTGYPVAAFLADPHLWLTLIHPDDQARIFAFDPNDHLAGEPYEQEYRIIRSDGKMVWVREEARIIESHTNADTMLSHGFFVDITQRKNLEDQLGLLAFQDSLTGLANRTLFTDRLTLALARSQRSGVYPAVLFLDLDEFKMVNDSLGHGVGDKLLRIVGERLHSAVRPADCVARLGGDEFAILLEDVAAADLAVTTANRLLDVLREPIEIEGRKLVGRGSIGIAIAGMATASPDALLRDADAAMYRAKADGRGRWVLFEPEMHTEALERFELESDLRVALANDELRVVLQPIYSLQTGRARGAEALARWDHPIHGPISPVVFIPIAEDSDLILDIGERVLRNACEQAATWRLDGTVGEDFVISVNVSVKQLTSDLPGIVARILAETGLPARILVVEVTESAVMRDAQGAIEILSAIRESGVAVAVDDFGTGYSSLGYLQTLPIDIIKIDRSFVADVEKPFESALIRAVIQIAGALALSTVAEGVETEEQAEALAALGCESGQGFLFGRPEPAATCELRPRPVRRQPVLIG
jgi:diguanylate cyclase (GGDEF)-like protein